MVFKGFYPQVLFRAILILLTMVAFSYLLVSGGFYAFSIAVGMVLLVQVHLLLALIKKTNLELVRFFDALRYADFSQRFEFSKVASGFTELGQTFTHILNKFQTINAQKEQQFRHLRALVEHVPVPLISLQHDGQINVWNNSARRLFGTLAVTQTEDLKQFGDDFAKQLIDLKLSERRLVNFSVDGMTRQLAIQCTQVVLAGKQEKLVSLQDIQSELDSAQLQAWQDLVKVLTHEIMNSITPVTSLAKTAVDLVDDVKQKVTERTDLVDELNDVSEAVNTVARRGDGLMKFVGSYRKLTRLPPAAKHTIEIQVLFERVSQIASQHWPALGIALIIEVSPATLSAKMDADMVEQLLINLLKNAEQALHNVESGQVYLTAKLNSRGHTVIEVGDNGPGIPEDIADKVFVPFFTTKREGSGVGLALTRQVMLAHGGSVKLDQSHLGGALISLIF